MRGGRDYCCATGFDGVGPAVIVEEACFYRSLNKIRCVCVKIRVRNLSFMLLQLLATCLSPVSGGGGGDVEVCFIAIVVRA